MKILSGPLKSAARDIALQEQRVVDFDKLDEYAEAFSGCDVGYGCLGAYVGLDIVKKSARVSNMCDRLTASWCILTCIVSFSCRCNFSVCMYVYNANMACLSHRIGN